MPNDVFDPNAETPVEGTELTTESGTVEVETAHAGDDDTPIADAAEDAADADKSRVDPACAEAGEHVPSPYECGCLPPSGIKKTSPDPVNEPQPPQAGHADLVGLVVIAAVLIVLLVVAYIAGIPVSR